MPLKLYKRGKIWWVTGTVNGERIRVSTKTTHRDIAEQTATEIESRTWKGHYLGPETVVTFGEAVLLYIQAGRSDRYVYPLRDYWRDTVLKDITGGIIRQAAIKLYPRASGATRNRSVLGPTQAIINHAAEMELCQPIRVKRFPEERKEKTPATWEWVQAFMAHSSPHLGALCCFMFLTGARVSEAISVTWSDVDLSKSRALIKQTKIGVERWAHLPEPLVAAIANIEGERVGKVFKFSSRNTIWKQWVLAIKKAEIEHLSPHCCRHGFATSMLQAGIDPVTVAKRGGWQSPQHVFQTYGHAMEDETITDVLIGTPEAQRKRRGLKRA